MRSHNHATPAGNLTAFLQSRLEPLVDRSIEIAKKNGYAPFTTTIRAAWVEAILSVTESLGAYLESCDGNAPGPHATLDYKADPRFARMRLIARQHRSLGITLPMYIGLFKHFRNIYADELTHWPGAPADGLTDRVQDFFDETELSIAADWYSSDDNQRLRELQERTRAATLDKDRYFAIFESLRNPAFLLDKAQTLVNANQAAAELFLGHGEAGEIVYLRSMRRRKNALQKVIDQIMASAGEPDRLVWLKTLSGKRCFDVRLRVLHDAVENIALGHVILLNDVTEHRRATEKAEKSERGMSRFLATMSHEIRTPLHSVLGAAELLRTSDPDTAKTYLDVIKTAGQTLLQTLNNVLDYSKLANEPPVPRPGPTHLALALEAFGRVAALGRDGGNARLTVDIAQDLPPYVVIDWAMTQQVLSNLVSNAIRVDDGSGVDVRIFHAGGADDAGVLRFEVRDHGPGIPASDAEVLFHPFEKTNARHTGGGGAGLGLAIAHHLVEAMRGRIGYRNREVGALVWFEVPFEAATAPPMDLPVQGQGAGTASPVARFCLLVDDDPIGTTVTTHQLERIGFNVTHAATASAALAAVELATFDVFIVDYLLPDGDGPSLVRDLRARHKGAARYVALTANVEALADNDRLASRFDGILAKPADQATLAEALSAHTACVSPPAADEDAATPNLDGLSANTVAAMLEKFQSEWGLFRQSLAGTAERADLAHHAHRLAGSTAILGLKELEDPLRELERRCREDGEIAALKTRLDCDLTHIAAWNRVFDRAGSP